MSWLNYHHLYYFLKIAETGSISQASQLLRLGQPTLSVQLATLEEQLGQLFERRNRKLVLTERGHVVLKYARDIFSRGDELLRVVERGELAEQRQIALGALEGVPKSILASTMFRLRKISKAKIMVTEGSADDLLQKINDGSIDLIVTDHELNSQSPTVFLPIGQERLSVWKKNSRTPEKEKFPQCLNGADFVLPTLGHPLRTQLDGYFALNSLTPKIVCEVPDTALVKELGAQGMGMIALGETTVKSWVRVGRLQLVGRTSLVQKYWLGIPKKLLKDPLLVGLHEEFKAG
jgi:LysR family transcriptional regulator, transcriptional activator of nhaA